MMPAAHGGAKREATTQEALVERLNTLGTILAIQELEYCGESAINQQRQKESVMNVTFRVLTILGSPPRQTLEHAGARGGQISTH